MSKSAHNRVFNPTGEADWDKYYETFWGFWLIVLVGGVVLIAVLELV